MADEGDNVHVSQKTNDEQNASIRNNTNEQTSSKTKVTGTVPHYLKPSTGSCHDICKYGGHHSFEKKAKRPIRRKVSKSQQEGENSIEIQIFVARKGKKAVEPEKLDPSSTMEKKSYPGFPSSKRSPPSVSSKPITKSVLPEFSNSRKKNVPLPGKSSSPDAAESIKKEVTSLANKEVSSKQARSYAKGRNCVKADYSKPSNSSNSDPSTVKKSPSPTPSTGSSGKINRKPNSGNDFRIPRVAAGKMVAPPMASLSPKRFPKVAVKKVLAPPKVSAPAKVFNAQDVKSNMRKSGTQKAESKKTSAFPKDRRSTRKNESVETIDEKVEEKTLHIIEMKNDSSSNHLIQSPSPLSPESLNSSSNQCSSSFSSPDVNDQDDSENADTEADSNDDGVEDVKKVMVDSEDKGHESIKLKIKKGKVIDFRSDTISPRKLRFRKGKTLGDNQGRDGGPQRSSFRKRTARTDASNAKPVSEKVVLRHQDVQEKKDAQVVSLNNVIEETASKLVQAQRSKVKALVGAFETVITLQKHQPSADR